MENRLKLRISRMFRSSFGTCRSRNLSDVIGKPVFIPQNNKNLDVIEPMPTPMPPKPRPYPSICKPRCPITSQELVHNSCIIATKEAFTRQKVTERYSLFYNGDHEGRTCPHASPMSPPTSSCNKQVREFESRNREKRFRKKKKKMMGHHSTRNKKRETWFSSEEETEDETETLFSSKSLSSDSSRSRRVSSRRKTYGSRRRTAGKKDSDVGLVPLKGPDGKVKDSFAVVKRSSDPHGDFRTSMVEMIVERQIFSANDLEQLLQCFLALNSDHHHKVIVEVFMEIWEALFSNWP